MCDPAQVSAPRRAAILIIGNEILTGKVREANVHVAAELFFELGIALERIIVCVDDVDTIASDVRRLSDGYDVVLTSGGIGPTHDDMTYEGVAKAFSRDIIREPELERMLRAYHEAKGYEVTDAQLRMANIVQGARLLRTDAHPWPTMVVENVFVLPGVPEIFRLKMPLLRTELGQGQRFYSQKVFTHCREGEIADLLESLESRFESVQVGSYLNWDRTHYSVMVSFDSEDEQASLDAAQVFIDAIGPKFVSRDDPPS